MTKEQNVKLVLFIMVVFVVLIGWACNSCTEEPVIVKTKVELRQEFLLKQFSVWDGSHFNLETLIKNNLNDPNSYEHEKTTFKDYKDYLMVTTVFRAKNGFGGMVRKVAVGKVDLEGNVLDAKIK